MTIVTTEQSITEREAAQIERANASSATPVVFGHGLWLLPSSWDNWVTSFEEAAGYMGLPPDWPDDPETVEEARANPDVLAKKTLKEVADHTTDHQCLGQEASGHRRSSCAQVLGTNSRVSRLRGQRLL